MSINKCEIANAEWNGGLVDRESKHSFVLYFFGSAL